MATPLRGCRAPSTRIRVTSHRMVFKMVIPGLNFHKPQQLQRLSQLTLQIYPRTLQEHSTSMHSVRYAYFRVSLQDCAIHSSRWVNFANFGFVGFRFLVRFVKMMRAVIIETTARLWCVRVFAKLGSVTYVSICCLPHLAIMRDHERGSKDICRPHNEACAC